MKSGYTYILASTRNGTLYVGVTSDLLTRIQQHKNKTDNGFTKKYDVTTLVHYEHYRTIKEAIKREKSVKKWHRAWKITLIEKTNPEWKDLFTELIQTK